MTDPTTTVLSLELVNRGPDEADLAALAFLARYSGRTLDVYRAIWAGSSSGPATMAWS
jgi:hypothetical protein